MNELKYKIEFFSEWHCGSGLSAGADVDALVVKDPDGLPFIPGKTLKGLIREAVEDYAHFAGVDVNAEALFGIEADRSGQQCKGILYFTDATLSEAEHQAIISNRVQDLMYQKRSRTAIDAKGIARDHSLRSIETVVPCTMYASIINLPDNAREPLTTALSLVKRLGVNRNRGLGRCQLTVVEKGGER